MSITSPLQITPPGSCIIWLDASDTTTLSSFSATNVDLANNRNRATLIDGQQIGFWGNKASNQYHFTNSFGLTGNRPFYISSLSALEFTSQDKTFLTANFGTTIGPQTIIVFTMAKDGVQGYRIFTQHVNGAEDSANIIPLIQANNNGNIGSFRSSNYQAAAPTTRAKGKFFVACYRNTGSQIQNSIDLNIPTTFATTVGTLNIGRMRLGGRIQATGAADTATSAESHYDGFIREVMVFNKSLTIAERDSVIGYLSGKWNLEEHQQGAIYALQSGNWDSILWSTSGLPGLADTVYSNGFTVLVNQPLTTHILTNRFGQGTFSLSGDITLSASLILGGGGTGDSNTSYCITYNPPIDQISTIISPVCCRTANNAIGHFSNTGTLCCIGDFLGGERNNFSGSAYSAAYLNNSLGTLTIVGNLSSPHVPTGSNTGLARNNSNGTLIIEGNIIGGQSVAVLNQNASTTTPISGNTIIRGSVISGNHFNTGTINCSWFGNTMIYGNVIGGSVFGGIGIAGGTNFEGTITIFGSVSGGTGQNAHGASNPGLGTLIITGSAFGSTAAAGVVNGGSGVVVVEDAAIGGLGADGTNTTAGAINVSNGSLDVGRAVGNIWGRQAITGYTGSAPGVRSTSLFGQTTVKALEIGLQGVWPTVGNVYINESETTSISLSTALPLNYIPDVTYILPPTGTKYYTTKFGGTSFIPALSNVRLGVVYDLGTKTGTLIMPNPAVVLKTEPINDGFGQAEIESDFIWQTLISEISGLPQNTIGARLLNAISLQRLGDVRVPLK